MGNPKGLPSPQRCFAAARYGLAPMGLLRRVAASRVVGVAPASLVTARLLPERLFVERLG